MKGLMVEAEHDFNNGFVYMRFKVRADRALQEALIKLTTVWELSPPDDCRLSNSSKEAEGE